MANYLSPDDLADALEESQQAGQPTEKVCAMFRMIATRLLGNPHYRNYPHDFKEDLVSAGLIKAIKSIRLYKPEKRKGCFSFFTRCIECAYLDELRKRYRRMNLQRQLVRDYAETVLQGTQAGQRILDGLLPENTTHRIDKRTLARKRAKQ